MNEQTNRIPAQAVPQAADAPVNQAENPTCKYTLQSESRNETKPPFAPLPLWTALTSYGIGYLYIVSFIFGFALDSTHANFPRSWAPLLFAVVFFGWGIAVIKGGRARGAQRLGADQPAARDKICKENLLCSGCAPAARRESWFWLGCSLLIAAALAAGRCRATGKLVFWVLHGMAAYWVLCRSGALTEQTTGPFFVWDAFDALVLAPFGGFFTRLQTLWAALWAAVRRHSVKKVDAKSVWVSAALVLLAVPVLVAAGGLLSQADAAFAAFWHSLGLLLQFQWPQLPQWVGEVGARLLLSIPVGMYLYGLVSCGARRSKPLVTAAAARAELEHARIAPAAGLYVILGLFCGLYAIFFVFQAGHLFGAFWGSVPGTSTAAEYAREGFFQLCQVMAINFGLLLAAAKLSRAPLRSNRLLRGLAVALMAESLLLAVTAASKLWLYIDRFGFTPRRLLSSWAVLVLAAGCMLAIASLRRPCRAAQKWIWFAAGSFALLCLY